MRRGRRPAPPGRPAPGGRRQRVGGLPVFDRSVTQPRPAVRQRGPRGRVGGRPGQVRPAASPALRYVASASSVLPVASSSPATAVRLRPTSTLVSASGPRLGRQRLAGGQDLPVGRQGVLLAADLVRQVGQLEVGLRQRPPRRQVRLLAEQGTELAVEVGRRLQQPVAQVLELLLLEQEVLADAGVERLDRVRRQLVPRLHRRTRLAELGRWLRSGPRSPSSLAFSEAASRALATVCTAATAASPPSSVSSTRLAAITAPRCFRTNFRSR